MGILDRKKYRSRYVRNTPYRERYFFRDSKYESPLKPDLKPQRYQRCFLDRCRHRGGPLRRRVATLHTVAHCLYLVIFQVWAGSDYTVYLLEVG